MLAKKIETDPEPFAKTFLNILKNEVSVRNEFSVYRKLYDPNPAMNFSGHAIHKVILNVANLFFQTLADKEVIVDISNTDLRLSLDYESMQVALYHLMDNAAKYVEPKSTISIYIDNTPLPQVTIKMTSLYIEEQERPRIFDEGVSGRLPSQLGSAGKGLGMGLVRDLLALNSATITVNAGERLERRSKTIGSDIWYAANEFIISFTERSVLSKGQSIISKPVATGYSAVRHYASR